MGPRNQFGEGNSGLQLAYNEGTIINQFHTSIAQGASHDTLNPEWQERVQKEEENRRLDIERKILELLRTTEYETFKARNEKRVPGTCRWFLEHQQFLQWEANIDTKRLLWVSADPGCGKSVLARSLIDRELKSSGQRTTCYFFFKEDNDKQHTLSHALCAMLHQLFSQKRSLIEYARPAYQMEGKHLPDLTFTLWEILVNASTDDDVGEIFCVLDALDECEKSSRLELIRNLNDTFEEDNASTDENSGDTICHDDAHDGCEKLSCQSLKRKPNNSMGEDTNLQNKNKKKLKFLITSRRYFDIERSFQPMIKSLVAIHLKGEEESKAISSEIDLVIKSKIPRLGQDLELTSDEQHHLEQELLRVPHRTYLWLKLIIEYIHAQLSITGPKLRRIIRSIPDSLDKAYNLILKRCTDIKQARKLLSLVVFAVRPLTLGEMRIALELEAGKKSYEELDPEKESTFARTARNLCGLFVSVVDSKIYLIHHTAKEFLLGQSLTASDSWKYSLDPTEGELLLLETCIAFLNFKEFDQRQWPNDHKSSDLPNISELLRKHSFLAYAGANWIKHYRLAKAKITPAVSEAILRICNPTSFRYKIWFSVYQDRTHGNPEPLSEDPRHIPNSLVLFSILGTPVAIKEMMNELNGVPRHDGTFLLNDGTCPLRIVNACGRSDQTALSSVAEKGDLEIVEMLLQHGADVNTRKKNGASPISLAAAGGHASVVDILIKYKANLNSRDNHGHPPLWYAICRGRSTSITGALLDHGANLEKRDYAGRTPLFWAVMTDDETLMNFLIGRGANIHHEDKKGMTAFFYAAAKKRPTAIKAILASKTELNVNTISPRGLNSLCVAVEFRPLRPKFFYQCEPEERNEMARRLCNETLQVLLDHGANTELEDSNGQTALSRAVYYHSYHGVELLLKRGANIEHANSAGQTPLLVACGERPQQELLDQHFTEPLLKLLISHGAMMEHKDRMGLTPLALASKNNLYTLVKILLENGTDIETRDKRLFTPLALAANEGWYQVVEMLIKKGADIEAKNANNQTPLMLAILVRQQESRGTHETLETTLRSEAPNEVDRQPISNQADDAAPAETDTAVSMERNDSSVSNRDSHGLRNHLHVVKCLSQRGADLSCLTENGLSMLGIAVGMGDLDLVEVLVQAGADVDWKDGNGDTLFQYAESQGHKAILEFLHMHRQRPHLESQKRLLKLAFRNLHRQYHAKKDDP